MLKPKLTLLVIIITYSRDQPLMKNTFFAVLATETCVMWSSFRAACVAWSRCVAFRDLRSSSWPCAGSTRIWRREWLVSVGWSGFDMQRRWLTETLYHFSYPPVFRAGEQGRFWYAVLGGSLEVRYAKLHSPCHDFLMAQALFQVILHLIQMAWHFGKNPAK